MILLDGKKLSEKILGELREKIVNMDKKPRLAAIVVGENAVIKKFVDQKTKIAKSIGIELRAYPFEESITTNELRKRISEIVRDKKNTGVIVQLPLPRHINTQYILNTVPPEKDVDMLSARARGNFVVGKSEILPPVVGAVKTFFDEYAIDHQDKYVVVIGAGKLVGAPLVIWLLNEKSTFSVLRSETPGIAEFTRKADIIISGAGKPEFITEDIVKDGIVVIDAGTSESEGKIVGDVDFKSVSKKASFITPTPGGVGPLTVAMLLKNLVILGSGENK